MKIHEFQAKEILRAHGVPVPRGEVADTREKAREIAGELGGLVVVKAQITPVDAAREEGSVWLVLRKKPRKSPIRYWECNWSLIRPDPKDKP